MFIFKNSLTGFNKSKYLTKAGSGNNTAYLSQADCKDTANTDLETRIRVAFTAIKRERESKIVNNAIEKEFGKKMPLLATKVQKLLFNSAVTDKTIGIG